jgi:hypothetical protein
MLTYECIPVKEKSCLMKLIVPGILCYIMKHYEISGEIRDSHLRQFHAGAFKRNNAETLEYEI